MRLKAVVTKVNSLLLLSEIHSSLMSAFIKIPTYINDICMHIPTLKVRHPHSLSDEEDWILHNAGLT